MSREDLDVYFSYVKRRKSGEPIAYILGRREFYGLDFFVSPDVLIPRSDTEVLVDKVLEFMNQKPNTNFRIVDIGTGSGCVLLSILSQNKFCTGIGVDISGSALKIAKQNAENLGLLGRVTFVDADILTFNAAKIHEMTDKNCVNILVSNPPYIMPDVINQLDKSVKDFEPHLALNGGSDGLIFYRKFADFIGAFGAIFVEIGFDQGAEVGEIFLQCTDGAVQCYQDFGGNDRVISALCFLPI